MKADGSPSDQDFIDRKRRVRMDRIDHLPPDIRELVNNYGFYVVDAFMLIGVTKAKHIRHLVETVLDEFSPTRGTKSNQGLRTDGKSSPLAAQLDERRT